MQPWSVTLTEGLIAGVAGSILFGVGWTIRLLLKMDRAMSHLGGSIESLYRIQPYLAGALRHQNGALKEAGANGSVEKANACLDKVDEILQDRLADLEGQLGTPKKEV